MEPFESSCSAMEDSDLVMAQLLNTGNFSNDDGCDRDAITLGLAPLSSWPNYYDGDHSNTYSADNASSYMLHWAQWSSGSSSSSGACTNYNNPSSYSGHYHHHESYYLSDRHSNSLPAAAINPNNCTATMDVCVDGSEANFLNLQNTGNHRQHEDSTCLNLEMSCNDNDDRQYIGNNRKTTQSDKGSDDINSYSDHMDDEIVMNISPKKKAKQTYENKNNNAVDPRQKKAQKSSTVSGGDDQEEGNCLYRTMSSSYYSSEEDSHTSRDHNRITTVTTASKDDSATANLNGKKRASRGSATDPQSLYARKRRERINERLRILQNLVPNGTKVDISTMLEEAVQYVKFLQLQIKLLSSDDLWMYAPIAYNGMNIGLDFKFPPQ